MRAESIVLTVAGMCFGIIVGWVLAELDADRRAGTMAQVAASAPAAPAQTTQPQGPPPLDEARVKQLTTILENDPTNVDAAVKLGSAYFEAEQFDKAIDWYSEALRLDPDNAEVSTELGMAYFFAQEPDPALAQLEKSLQMDPNYTRALLSKGIVLWQAKQDYEGAAAAWEKLVEIAPDSPDAQLARQGLEAIAARRQGAQAPASHQ